MSDMAKILDLGHGQDLGSLPRPRSWIVAMVKILALAKILDLEHGRDLGSLPLPRSVILDLGRGQDIGS
jgi:hypothetical protein